MKPNLPSGLQWGTTFIIPDDWSPEQALAVFELLDDLRHIIGERYQLQMLEYLKEQRGTDYDPASDSIDENDPPF